MPNNIAIEDDDLQGGKIILFDADPQCTHELVEQWSGIRCAKCPGWFCF